MSIETEFESTITNVKNAYQGLDNLGATIPQNKTIENIKNCLDEIYNNLPKTSYAEGSNITLSNCLKGKLDFEKEYQEVEYIESTGPAYIDTGFIPNTNTKIDIQFETIQKGTNGVIFGGEETYNGSCFHLYNTSGNFDIGFGSKGTGFATSVPYDLNTKYKFIMDKNGFDVNGTAGTFPEPTISTNSNIFLFVVKRASSMVIDSNAQKRIYYCKLYNNGTLVRDLIPCYRKIDNVIGLYDKVEGKFYTNAGTGTFTKGADVGSGFRDIVGYGQTSQKIYQGYQLIPYTLATLKAINTVGTWNNNVYTYNGITYTIEEENGYIKEIKTTGTATSNSILALISTLDISAGTYYLSGCPNGGSYSTYFIYSGPGLAHNVSETPTTITFNEDTSLSSNNMRITILSGTSLSNLIWKPMLSKTNTTDFEPFVGNSPSPNPSYQQDIEVVRGKNRAKLDQSINNRNTDITYTENVANSIVGSKTSNNGQFLATFVAQVVSGQTYTISGTATNCNLYAYKETLGGESFGNISASTLPKSFTSDYTGTIVLGMYFPSAITGTASIKDFQLEKGSQATSYLPYNTLEVKVQNKNLVDVSKMQFGTISQTDGTTISSSGDVKYSDYINVKPNETYALSFGGGTPTIRIFKYDKNKNYLGTSAGTSSTITIDSNTYYIRLQGNKSFIDNNFQLELGSTVTSYIAHAETLYQLSLGEYEFAKIGNYVDTIEYDVDEDKVYKNKAINKFNGGELNWTHYDISINGVASHLFRTAYDTGVKKATNGLSNYYTCLTQSTRVNPCFYINNDNPYIDVVDNNHNDGTEYKTYCNSNNIVFYAPLETPTKEEITTTLKDQIKALYYSHSFTGTTIIEIDGQLPLIIKVRALKGE